MMSVGCGWGEEALMESSKSRTFCAQKTLDRPGTAQTLPGKRSLIDLLDWEADDRKWNFCVWKCLFSGLLIPLPNSISRLTVKT